MTWSLEALAGLFLFVLLMTGVLAERSGGVGPSAVAAGCWVFVAWSYVSFKRRHRWQHLEVEEILQAAHYNPDFY